MVGLAIFLFSFSYPLHVFNGRSLAVFGLLIGFLLVFRLYDDLLQAQNDLGKPDRDHTAAPARRSLFQVLFVCFGILLGFAALVNVRLALLLFCFITVNHLLYSLLVNHKAAAGFLPLVKYPFVYLLLQSADPLALTLAAQFVLPTIGLFFAFVAFESLEDRTFVVPIKYSYILQFLSLALIAVGQVNKIGLLSFSLLFALSMLWTFFRLKAYPYVYMFCFLVLKIVVDKL